MDIPRTIIRRSVVLQRISKPELNRPKLANLFLSTKYIQSNYEFYATEQNMGLREALRCYVETEQFDKLGGLQEETNKNDSESRAVSRDLTIQ